MTSEHERDVATLLEPVQSMVEVLLRGGDLVSAATPEAASALDQLATLVDFGCDRQAAHAAGLGYFFRSIAVPDVDERSRCFVQALVLLRPKPGEQGVMPEPVMDVYQANPDWLTEEWRPALALDAEKLGRSGGDDPFALSLAIALLRETLRLAPAVGRSETGWDRPRADLNRLRFENMTNLSVCLRVRSEITGSEKDLDESLALSRECLVSPSASEGDRASLELNLSLACRDISTRTPSREHRSSWLAHAREAVRHSDENDARRPTLVENLVAALHANPGSDETNAVLEEILDATAPVSSGGRGRAAEQSLGVNRGAALIARYEREHQVTELDEAVQLLRCLIDQPGMSAGDLAGCLSNLSVALMMRNDVREVALDLQEGLAAARRAVQVARPDDPELPTYRSNLSLLALTWAARSGNSGSDLDLAVDAARTALAATPAEDESFAAHATNLATALTRRSAVQPSESGRVGASSLADLDEAGSLAEQAAQLRQGQPDAGRYLANVVAVALGRYRAVKSSSDLDAVLARCDEALTVLGETDPARAGVLIALAETSDARRREGDLARSATAAHQAAEISGASLPERLGAADAWAKSAGELADWPSACRAYDTVLNLIESAISPFAARSDEERAISRATGLASRAAAAHLMAGDPEGATMAFERSHAVLLARQLGSQKEVRALARLHQDLAGQYRELNDQLAALDRSPVRADIASSTPGDVARERARLLERLTDSLTRIRALDGFSSFAGRGIPLPDLHTAGKNCPVVLLSVSDARSDAILITSSGIEVVRLPAVKPDVVVEKATLLWGAIDDAQQDFTGLGAPLLAERVVLDILCWLWDAVAEPVLHALGLDAPPVPGDAWPVICWCPSGFLSLLPLHAAGHHGTRTDAVPRTVLDRVVSTYTPTVGALIAAGGVPEPVSDEVVVVAMPETPGARDLPGAATEAGALKTLTGGRVRLLGPLENALPATLENVLAALPARRWAHFACHAVSDTMNPSRSRLLLADGDTRPLTIPDLMALDLDGPELAYLSACATGRPAPGLVDEVVHLASAFMVAGYPHVVATLWPVGDRSAAFVAEHFYRELLQPDSQRSMPGATAMALHNAVRGLRDLAPDRPSKWSAHVHVGGVDARRSAQRIARTVTASAITATT